MGSTIGMAKGRREQACKLFKTAQEDNLIQGRSIEAMAAMSIYAFGRLNRDQYLLEGIGTVARVGRDSIANAYGVFNRELEIPTLLLKPQQYLARICPALDLEERHRLEAGELLEAIDEYPRVATCNPAGIAASAGYLAINSMGKFERPTQSEIGEVADVAPSSLRERAQDIEEEMQSS